MSQAYIDWLYLDNPNGLAQVVIASQEDQWVGFLALVPVALRRGQDRKPAFYVVNVLVHPEYQGKHIFSRMIGVAKSYAKDQAAFLMGHPNKAALPMWKRARMQFHQSLRPTAISPGLPFVSGVTVRIESIEELVRLGVDRESEGFYSEEYFQVEVSSQYVNWRYLKHPFTSYQVRAGTSKGRLTRLAITKRVRPMAHLLVDYFAPQVKATGGKPVLPWFTVAFGTEAARNRRSLGEMSIPVKKEIPFFCTDGTAELDSHALALLGLSASDF